jgi:HEAT repeat protein
LPIPGDGPFWKEATLSSAPDRFEPPNVLADGQETPDAAKLRDIGGWVVQLGRTLKTCRLYDADNPTVVRFREGLASDLKALLERHGPIRLEVTSRELLHEGQPAGAGRSREESLAPAFHRDGIREITFLPGIEPREVDAFVDQVLRVTGPAAGDDDLVTLLWEAQLPSIGVTSVPLEGDVDGAGDSGAEDAAPLPWPKPVPGAATSAGAAAEVSEGAGAQDTATRSDDWEVLARAGHLDHALGELEQGIEREIARFRSEHEAENGTAIVQATVEVLADGVTSEATSQDREELAAFLPRVLREAVAQGEWRAARDGLKLLRDCIPSWSAESFFEGFAGPSTLVTRRTVAILDQQNEAGIGAFLELASEFGPLAADWLMQLLAESQQKRVRLPLSRALAELVRDNPERILPWMSDERWYVVRNVVHILGWIGGDTVVGYLRAVNAHAEPRVRREIVAALSDTSPANARPILLSMLAGAESRVFTTVLHQLALDADPVVTERLVALLRDEGFARRADDERRAIFIALAGQGDAALSALEDELARGGLFDRGLDPHWQAVARCIARIGTPAALEALERGTRSRRGGVRKACELAKGHVRGQT